MDGKTFIRAFLFSNAYGHEWARIFDDPDGFGINLATAGIGPFVLAFDMEQRQRATDAAERAAAEARMVWLVDTLEKQKKFIESVSDVQGALDEKCEDNDDIEPGIHVEKAFSIGDYGSLRYDHVTGTGRLEVHAHDGIVNFSISRPNEPDLFCLTVEGKTFRIHSGKPDSPLAEDENASRSRWERLLRLRHVEALQKALVSFYALEEDRSLLQDLLAAVNETAISVFRAQEETVELYCYLGAFNSTPKVILSEAGLPDKARSALHEALVQVSIRTVPVLIPFDYASLAPNSDFWQKTFDLPTVSHGKEIPVEDRHGTLIVFADYREWYSEWRNMSVVCALGVTPCEIQRFVELRREKNPDENEDKLYLYGSNAAVEAKDTSILIGSRRLLRTLKFNINSPEVSIAALEANLKELEEHIEIEAPIAQEFPAL